MMKRKSRAARARPVVAAQPALPAWIVKLLVGAVITGLMGGGLAWATYVGGQIDEHSRSIAVQKEAQQSTKENIAEIKQDVREIKQILQRQSRTR